MTELEQKLIEQTLKEHDVKVDFCDGYAELEFVSNLGEDVVITLEAPDINTFVENLQEYDMGESYIDEHVKALLGINSNCYQSVIDVETEAEIIGDNLNYMRLRLAHNKRVDGELTMNHIKNAVVESCCYMDNTCPVIEVHADYSINIEGMEDNPEAIYEAICKADLEFDESDYIREYYGVSEEAAIDGCPTDIPTLIQDVYEQKDFLCDMYEDLKKTLREYEKESSLSDKINDAKDTKDYNERKSSKRSHDRDER